MFRDTTARNRAHQRFGELHWQWLVAIKVAPWAMLFLAACVLWGADVVARAIVRAVGYVADRPALVVASLTSGALLLFWVKRRWRRNDYRP